MTFSVMREFKIRGVVQEVGSLLKLSKEQAEALSGYITPAVPDSSPTGDPVHCRFWFQVCWAVQLYQDQCTRDTDCRVYKFLEKQGDYSK